MRESMAVPDRRPGPDQNNHTSPLGNGQCISALVLP
jgi:hypothetical protein